MNRDMFTVDQNEAIFGEGRAMMVEAGAGTGKTTVLTERFLHLLDAHPDWAIDSIVAVTFTEKAAHEMRSRIRAKIEQRANETGSALWQRAAGCEALTWYSCATAGTL